METKRDVAVLVGSLRKDSFTRKVARALEALAPPSLVFEIVEIGDLPLYNQDLEEHPPASWRRLRERIKRADAVLFATPEYNRSVPGLLKNAIDVGSRPYGQSAWDGKPGAIISVAPGAIGGFGANHHLRQMLTYLNVYALAQPEAYVGGIAKLMDDTGKVTNADTEQFLRNFATAFRDWIERLSVAQPPPPSQSR